MYGIQSFRWSESDYTPKELIERFGHQLPCLISVTEGYMGTDEWVYGIPTSEISWLYAIARQSRVVLKDADDRYYSIPESYEGLVIPITSSGQDAAPRSVQQVLMDSYRSLRFVEQRNAVYDGGDCGAVTRLGKLEVVDTYDERFLMVHVLTEGKLYPEFAVIPVYVPIKVSIAMTTTAGGQRTFFTSMLEFNDFSQRCRHDHEKALKLFAQITVFEGKPETGDYDYISVIPLSQTKKRKESKDSPKPMPVPPSFRDSPVAFGIYPEDRLRQLKHVLYRKEIPDDDAEEGLPDPSVNLSKKKKPKPAKNTVSKFKSLFSGQKGPKGVKKAGTDVDDQSSSPTISELEANGYESLTQRTTPKIPQSVSKAGFDAQDSSSHSISQLGIQDNAYEALAQKPPVPTSRPKLPIKGTKPLPDVPTKPSGSQTKHGKYATVPKAKARSAKHIKSFADVPSDLSSLTIDDVSICLELLHMPKYIDILRDQLVDGDMLMSLDESLMKEEFGLSPFEAKKLFKFANGYRPKM